MFLRSAILLVCFACLLRDSACADDRKRDFPAKTKLLAIAETCVKKDLTADGLEEVLERHLDRGHTVLEPGSERPTGSVTLPSYRDKVMEGESILIMLEDWEIDLNENTDDRFVIGQRTHFFHIGRHVGEAGLFSLGSTKFPNNGLGGHGFKKPYKRGSHELFVILSAHPVNGGKPIVLDVKVIKFRVIGRE